MFPRHLCEHGIELDTCDLAFLRGQKPAHPAVRTADLEHALVAADELNRLRLLAEFVDEKEVAAVHEFGLRREVAHSYLLPTYPYPATILLPIVGMSRANKW